MQSTSDTAAPRAESALPVADAYAPHRRALATIEEVLRSTFPDSPSDQLGVLAVATVAAVRRQLAREQHFDRGRRMRLIKTVIREYEKKLRTLTIPTAD